MKMEDKIPYRHRTQTTYLQLVYGDDLPSALSKVKEVQDAGGVALSLADHMKLLVPDYRAPRHPGTIDPVVTLTEQVFGKTRGNNYVAAVIHGGTILSDPDRMTQALEEGLTPLDTVRITNDELRSLINGRYKDEEFPMYAFSEFKDGITDLPPKYGIVMDWKDVRDVESMIWKNAVNNPLMISLLGGTEMVASAGKIYDCGVSLNHIYGKVDRSIPQVSLTGFWATCCMKINSQERMENLHSRGPGKYRFAVVPAEDFLENELRPDLSQIIEASTKYVPEAAQLEFKKEMEKLYEL